MKKSINIAENNGQWKGDSVGYGAIHQWVRRRLPQPTICQCCYMATDRLDLANISQEYKRDLLDWEWLCRKCHMTKDGRRKALSLLGKKNMDKMFRCKKCGSMRSYKYPCEGCKAFYLRTHRVCSIPGCNKKHKGNGLCNMHHIRLARKYADYKYIKKFVHGHGVVPRKDGE